MDLGEATAEEPWTPKKSAVCDETQFLYPSLKGDRSGSIMTGSIPATGTEQNHPSFQYPSPAVYESVTSRNLTCGRDEKMRHGKMSLREVMASEAVEDPGMPNKSVASDESELFYPSPKESVGGEKVGVLGTITERVEEDPAAPKAPKAMVEDIPVSRMEQSHPFYQSPTGRDEVGESPLLSSFQAMSVTDEPNDMQYTTENLPTGAHNQFSPDRAHHDQDQAGEQKSSTYADTTASFLHSQTRSILPFGTTKEEGKKSSSDESEKISRSKMASFVATTNSVTAVVAGKEEMKQAVAKDLNSSQSTPCKWFICDDDKSGTRYFVIQGSGSLASWQASLLFEPILFEGLDVVVHRGIYKASKGIYQQMLPEAKTHLSSR